MRPAHSGEIYFLMRTGVPQSSRQTQHAGWMAGQLTHRHLSSPHRISNARIRENSFSAYPGLGGSDLFGLRPVPGALDSGRVLSAISAGGFSRRLEMTMDRSEEGRCEPAYTCPHAMSNDCNRLDITLSPLPPVGCSVGPSALGARRSVSMYSGDVRATIISHFLAYAWQGPQRRRRRATTVSFSCQGERVLLRISWLGLGRVGSSLLEPNVTTELWTFTRHRDGPSSCAHSLIYHG
ncbi:hypothetical protein DFH09DRAFT_424212 [Mycena vulgaris]|nr:hypothetical protein DFH09DRAFT_424212 [Mycena vulgaris]